MVIIYPTVESVLETHERTVIVSGGGIRGVKDDGPLCGTLGHIQNDDYYPTLEKKLTRLCFGLSKFHCFHDGNKRIAITATSLMLRLNGYMAIVPRFMRDMENIVVCVASDIINEDFLHEIICAHIAFDPDNESIKLRVLEALQEAERRAREMEERDRANAQDADNR